MKDNLDKDMNILGPSKIADFLMVLTDSGRTWNQRAKRSLFPHFWKKKHKNHMKKQKGDAKNLMKREKFTKKKRAKAKLLTKTTLKKATCLKYWWSISELTMWMSTTNWLRSISAKDRKRLSSSILTTIQSDLYQIKSYILFANY